MRVLTSADVPQRKPLEIISKTLVTSEIVDQPRIVDAKKELVVIDQVVKVTDEIDTQEYINSFKGQAGIENIMKRFLETRDPTLFNQVKRDVAGELDEKGYEPVIDYASLPSDLSQVKSISEDAVAAFNTLPEDLVKGRSLNEFVNSCTDEEIKTYFDAIIEARKKKETE